MRPSAAAKCRGNLEHVLLVSARPRRTRRILYPKPLLLYTLALPGSNPRQQLSFQ